MSVWVAFHYLQMFSVGHLISDSCCRLIETSAFWAFFWEYYPKQTFKIEWIFFWEFEKRVRCDHNICPLEFSVFSGASPRCQVVINSLPSCLSLCWWWHLFDSVTHQVSFLLDQLKTRISKPCIGYLKWFSLFILTDGDNIFVVDVYAGNLSFQSPFSFQIEMSTGETESKWVASEFNYHNLYF